MEIPFELTLTVSVVVISNQEILVHRVNSNYFFNHVYASILSILCVCTVMENCTYMEK